MHANLPSEINTQKGSLKYNKQYTLCAFNFCITVYKRSKNLEFCTSHTFFFGGGVSFSKMKFYIDKTSNYVSS